MLSELLAADVDSLRGMSNELRATSGAIRKLKHSAAVTMPSSPIADIAAQTPNVVTHAYGRIADSISAMAMAGEASAASYEAVDAAFKEQLRRYQAGL